MPFSRAAQLEEDHFIPIYVTVSVAEEASAQVIYHYENFFGNITPSSYEFGMAK